MIVTGVLDRERYKSKALAGKPYTFDLDLDIFHVKLGAADAAYSDYLPMEDGYIIVDFDRDRRVVGYTVEGVLESYRQKSLRNRLAVDFGLHLAGAKIISAKAMERVAHMLPAPDSRGRLPKHLALAPA